MIDHSARYGAHRVLAPAGALPQAALRLDAVAPCAPSELEIAVEWLHVDATSFRQIAEAEGRDEGLIGRHILDLVARSGKLHNPVTGSGGMLTGRVVSAGPDFPAAPAPGTRIASLVSLTLTPLRLDRILAVDVAHARLRVEARAYLCAGAPWTALPVDLPETVALAALDVAGAAPRTRIRTRPGDRVVVLGGGGRSGLLASLGAKAAGAGSVVAVEISAVAAARARALGAATEIVIADVADPLDLAAKIGALADLTISCVSTSGAEPAAILATKQSGWILFFSMATSFPRAALAAEGFGSPVTMEIGNGFLPGHAEETLALVRRYPILIDWFG